MDKWFKKTKGGILVLDDLMKEGSNDKRVLHLFTRDSHHKGITVVYMTQDMFSKGRHAKTISRNAHYIIAFKNPRDQLAVRILASLPARVQTSLGNIQRCHRKTVWVFNV